MVRRAFFAVVLGLQLHDLKGVWIKPCFLERQIGLTKLYNEVDDGAYRDLGELHDALDEAVAAAYGWPASAAHDPQESNRLLLELNRAITAGEIDYHPFG